MEEEAAAVAAALFVLLRPPPPGGGRKAQIKPDDHCRNDCRSGKEGETSSSAPTFLPLSLPSLSIPTTLGVWCELPADLPPSST